MQGVDVESVCLPEGFNDPFGVYAGATVLELQMTWFVISGEVKRVAFMMVPVPCAEMGGQGRCWVTPNLA